MGGCNRHFVNEKELTEHRIYHCGNEQNPYRNNKNPEIIDRSKRHGAGIPKTDQYTTIKAGTIADVKNGNVEKRDYQSDKHHKAKIVGRNASVHGHTARTQTTRWNIPLNEQPPAKKPKHNTIGDSDDPNSTL